MELIIDYELLSKLYKDDPEEFERERKRILESYFDSLPEERQKKARQIQWQIEGELRKYKDPIARMNRMVELFWEQTNEFKDTLNGF
jgi:hypothetical protein